MNILAEEAKKNIFHVHTFRCGHAENIPDKAYVEVALELGASDIWFTDHAPFPDDPFGARMKFSELDEYLRTLSELKARHTNINIHIGLETEYFPSFDKSGYYEYLRSRPEIEMLLLGQHMAEMSDSPPSYSFSEGSDFLNRNEYKLLGNAIVQGASTGYFDAIAHPDRIFRRCDSWDSNMEKMSVAIIQSAINADIPLEMNLASAENPIYYKKQFWALVPDFVQRIVGYDAHFIDEVKSRYAAISRHLMAFGE